MSAADKPEKESGQEARDATADSAEAPDMPESVEIPETAEAQEAATAAETPDEAQSAVEQPEGKAAVAAVEGADAPAESPSAEAPARQPQAQEEVTLVQEGMHWYVLRVASNKEDQVREALERKVKIERLEGRVGRVLVPTQREKRVRGGTARVYHKKLYPGYVFVEMATDDDGRIPENVWFVIKETTGVGDFIGSGGKPSPMLMEDIKKMLAAAVKPEAAAAAAENLPFNQGDRVKVTEGPFENFEGTVDEINSQKGTVKVIVSIFGRPTPIEIEYWQVEQI